MKKILLLLPLVVACQAGKARSLLVIDITKGAGVSVLDRLNVEAGSTSAGKDTDAPAKLGVYLPSSVSGSIHVAVWGERLGSRVARGEAEAEVLPGEVTNISVVLQPYAGVDGGSDGGDDSGSGDAGQGGSVDAGAGGGAGGGPGSGGVGSGGGGAGGTGSGGALTPASLSVSPLSLDFGMLWLGTSAVKSFTISNGGGLSSGALSFTSNIPAVFVIQSAASGDCVPGAGLAGNSSCTVRVAFVPTTTGTSESSIVVTSTEFSKSVSVSGSGDGIRGVTGGQEHTCALLAGGTVKCWGGNSYGQLGINSSARIIKMPTTVYNLTGVTQVVAGMYHTCALLETGTVRCWGSNGEFQLGNVLSKASAPAPEISGLTGVSSIAAGSNHSCALLAGGSVKCWGDNSQGQLGDGSATTKTPTPVPVAGGRTDIRAIAAGGEHTCQLMMGGTVQCWGENLYGQVGDGTTIPRLTPVDVSALTGVTQLRTGYQHSCGLLADGGVKCWGSAGSWSNPTATAIFDTSGTALSGASWLGSGFFCSCAVLAGGGTKCWGRNINGELGAGDTTDSSVAVPVSGLTGAVTSDGSLAGGYAHTCAVVNGGAGLKCWGDNGYGQLGDLTTTSRLTPVLVALP